MIDTILSMLLAAASVSPDTAVGRWQTETRHGIVEIQRCGASLCGRLLSSDGLRTDPGLRDVNNRDAGLRARPVLNMPMLQGFSARGAVWDGGTIYNAEDGRTYSARITPVDANRLELRGCIFVPLCKTQTWTRVR